MALSIKVGTTWKTISNAQIKIGTTWKTPSKISINVGGTWKAVWPGVSVSPSTTAVSHPASDTIQYAQVRYNTNGIEYNNSGGLNNYSVSRGNWLDSGSSSSVWISRTYTGTAPYTDGIGTGRPSLGSTRDFGNRDTNSSAGSVTTTPTFSFWDVASGGTAIATATFNLICNYYSSCPFCCFTPDTLITMACGMQMPIGKIRIGDEIVTYDPSTGEFNTEKVDEIITRVARRMYRITFDNGTVLHCSDDHPLHRHEDGPASVVPQEAYKGKHETRELKVGDFITCIKATWWGPGYDVEKIEKIEYAEYLDMVYTLGNEHFFANNKLVY